MKANQDQSARTRRYTLLLAPHEFEMAKRIAASEFRTLPDFFRMHIHERAMTLGLTVKNNTPRASQPCAVASG